MATDQKMTRSLDEAERKAINQTAEAGREVTSWSAGAERETAIWLTDVGRDVVDVMKRVTDDMQRTAQTASRSMGLIADISQPVFDATQQMTTEISHCIQEDARIVTNYVQAMVECRTLAKLAELQRDLMVEHLRAMVETSERMARINTDAITRLRKHLPRAA